MLLQNLRKYAGVLFHFGELEEEDIVGVTNGLAWTEVGGGDFDHRSSDVAWKG